MDLNKMSTTPPKDAPTKEDAKKQLKENGKRIAKLQEKLFAQKEQSILIILQGMDASGKSSTVRDVFKYVNPAGIHFTSFKAPTKEEFAHDFLWRIHKHTPGKGMFSIFDRSQYEDVLIQRVHHWITDQRAFDRMDKINQFEQLLKDESNTTILKFFLHISKEEQEIQLKERIDNPEKRWKHNDGDWKEREYWTEYQAAYQDVFEKCSKPFPWHIIPADQSWYKKYLVSKVIVETMEQMNLQWPNIEIEA